jgi:hypothetical protein
VLAHGVRRGHTLWNRDGQALLASLPLSPHTADRRGELQALYQHLQAHIDRLDDRVQHFEKARVAARGSWGFASGSCCAIRLTMPSSAVVAWRGSRRGGVCAGMPGLALVLVRE